MKNFVIDEKGRFSADDVKIMWKNFAGAPDDFNTAGGKRSFTLVMEEAHDEAAIAQRLIEAGYNVKPRTGVNPETGEPEKWWTLNISVGFNPQTGNGPTVLLCRPGERPVKLNDVTISLLDKTKLTNICLDAYPYEWHRGAESGIKCCCAGFKADEYCDSRFERMFQMANAEYGSSEADETSPF